MKKKVYYKLNRYKVAKVEVESVGQEQSVKILNRETDRFAKSEDTYYLVLSQICKNVQRTIRQGGQRRIGQSKHAGLHESNCKGR